MSALATFEAAARLSSFTQAANELGVTQAAVSRQIKLLEDDLNTPLFVRAHRKVVLSPAGASLAATVINAFSAMAEMVDTIRRADTDDGVTIGATLAFSHFWILPRLSEFRTAHPEIKLRLVAEDNITDLRKDQLDVCIRFAQPPFTDGVSIASLADEVFPVCGPDLLERLGVDRVTADIGQMPLIASDNVHPAWLSWRSWSKALGRGPDLARASDASKLRFNHYTDAIEAAMNGEGVALGWAVLLERHLASGRLLRIGTPSLITEQRYHLLVPAGREPTPSTRVFLEWMSAVFRRCGGSAEMTSRDVV